MVWRRAASLKTISCITSCGLAVSCYAMLCYAMVLCSSSTIDLHISVFCNSEARIVK